MTNRVKQGGIFSSWLFNVYMNNLGLSLNSFGIGGSLGDNIINHLCYADDLCLISLSSSGMQHLLDICDTYANSHQLSYNATKSFSLCFRLKQNKINPPSFVLRKQIVLVVYKCKYLGIIVSEINCYSHLNKQMRKYYANAHMLLRKFSYCSPNVSGVCLNFTVPQCIVLLCGLIIL